MLPTIGLTLLILGGFWLAFIVWVTVMGWRYSAEPPGDERCLCGAFTLDDGDPLWANDTLHEGDRCSPARETITAGGAA